MKNDKGLNRRNFLRASVLGATGALVGKNAIAQNTGTLKSHKNNNVIYRTLGNTGIELPIVSMGVMRADNPALVRAAIEKGIVHFDTAHGYQKGRNEEMLGEIFADYPRDSFVVATKMHMRTKDRETGDFTDETDPEKFLEMLDTSLERLGLDYVDILYIHSIESANGARYKPLIRAAKKAKKQGKARFIGLSTHRRMDEVIEAAVDTEAYDVILTSYTFQHEDNNKLQKAIERAAKAGIGIVAMKTMAGGYHDRERNHPVNAKAALKWALQNEHIHTSIPGYQSFDELEESFSVMGNLSMTEEEIASLKMDDTSASLYCNGCDTCVAECRKKLPVPDLMRAYMYTYGYHQYEKAQDVLHAINDLPDSPCDDCSYCTVSCQKGFQIAERIKDVIRLKNVPGEFFA